MCNHYTMVPSYVCSWVRYRPRGSSSLASYMRHGYYVTPDLLNVFEMYLDIFYGYLAYCAKFVDI